MTKFSGPLKWLRELALSLPTEIATFVEIIRELEPSLQHLRVKGDLNPTSILPAITPVLGNLVCLELSLSGWSVSTADLSIAVEVILRYGLRLETLCLGLRLFGGSLHPPSAHFRTYAHALPQLRYFALRLKSAMVYDTDMLPAISLFLKDRPVLESLELVDDCSTGYIEGLHHDYWNLLLSFPSSFPRLKRLAMTIPSQFSMQEAARIIPHTVQSLALSGGGPSEWFCSKRLHLVCFLEVAQ
jgi:hypothetical protein